MNEHESGPAAAKYDRASPEKMQQIVTAARELFMAHGFSATSMEAIARAAGVGKATLYANFAAKDEIFGAVVAGESAMRGEALLGDDAPDLPLREMLLRFADSFVGLLLSSTNIAMYRIIAAEAVRFPELGRIFYEQGPARILARLARTFEAAMKAGLLREGPPNLLAAQFIGLIRADLQMRAMLGVGDAAGQEAWRAFAASGVDAFLRAYAPT
jgi:AcrR family transcriptional regulator